MKEEYLVSRGKGKMERQVAVYLMKVYSNKRTNREIGECFGIKGPAVSGIVKAVEGRMMKDKGLRTEIELLTERVKNEI